MATKKPRQAAKKLSRATKESRPAQKSNLAEKTDPAARKLKKAPKDTHSKSTLLLEDAGLVKEETGIEVVPIARWTAVFYIAGDVDVISKSSFDLSGALRSDLEEILKLTASEELSIAVQYDGPKGAWRYVLRMIGGEEDRREEQLGYVNSGSPRELEEFLRWAAAMCPSEKVGLVLGGPTGFDPFGKTQKGDRATSKVFCLSRDFPANANLDLVELGLVLRRYVSEQGGRPIDLLAVDGCSMQFLELAYELEGAVAVLLGSQTYVPGTGWDYTKVLGTWQKLVSERPGIGAVELARELVPEVLACYRAADPHSTFAVSAMELILLDDVARAFDTLCIGFMQSLGEGLIWKTRELALKIFDEYKKKDGEEDGEEYSDVYDCGSFFKIFGDALDAMADEAVQEWLSVTLLGCEEHSVKCFRLEIASHLARRIGLPEVEKSYGGKVTERLKAVVAILTDPKCSDSAAILLDEVKAGVAERVRDLAGTDVWGEKGKGGEDRTEKSAGRARDREIEEAIRKWLHLLPMERQLAYHRLAGTRQTAWRMARQCYGALERLLGNQVGSIGALPEAASTQQGLVIASLVSRSEGSGWPRWSGVSLYRPHELDDLMNANYQEFAFHQKIHWASLLGAANLIEEHPRALWRLVSSLLSTGGASTRRDLLRRLTGEDSVIWGLRNQFRVMAPAPTITLSLERRHRARNAEEADAPPVNRESYLLRLEAANRGAVILEQDSRVQPQMMRRALNELEELLQASYIDDAAIRRLRAIGGLLGEDIFQALGRVIEEERLAALGEPGSSNVHLQLQIPRELMSYPWELMYHRGAWLSERFAIGRQVFMETGRAKRVHRRLQGTMRPLIIGDPKLDRDQHWPQLPGARAEAEQVADWFERMKADHGDIIDFDRSRDVHIHTRLTSAEFRRLLRDGDYDIVHFAGHGIFNADDPEASAWVLSDGQLWALEIHNTLAEHPAPPWLVYANACQAAMETNSHRYQGSVFGLATAFINQGVAAYIAPLWPIEDLAAQFIAIRFYHQLLAERSTLGEALRVAKSEAMRLTIGEDSNQSTWPSLGWASLVLYGDPTEELFQALSGNPARGEDRQDRLSKGQTRHEAARESPKTSTSRQSPPGATTFVHAPDYVLRDWLKAPGEIPEGPRRSVLETKPGEDVIELVEEAGLRRWRVVGAAARRGRGSGAVDDGLPGSKFAEMLASESVRRGMASKRGAFRVIGRWVVGGFDGGFTGLVRQYDQEQVEREGLMLVTPHCVSSLKSLPPIKKGSWGGDRILLLVHGTFSKTEAPADGLGREFLKWAGERYRAVIGFDHWTLSKTPEENAKMLRDQLLACHPSILDSRRLDIITHSRGGLVARAFSSLLKQDGAIRNLIFVGTPNCGTDLANPANWGTMADALVNMTGIDQAKVFGKLAGLLARLVVMGVENQIPGLLAQNPKMAGESGSFLHSLQGIAPAESVLLAVVTSEFEPSPLVPNLKTLWKAAVKSAGDSVVDGFFGDSNDLVVNTRHVWCVGQAPADATKLPAFIPPGRVLIFTPPDSEFKLPEVAAGSSGSVCREAKLGVHHCNLFNQKETRKFLKEMLGSPLADL